MTNSATASLWLRVTGHLHQRGITVLGVVVAALKVSVQQLMGQAAGEIADSIASSFDSLPLAVHAGPITAAAGGLAAAAGMANAVTFGMAGAALLLVLPVGGPVWAGLVPVGATVTGVRRGAGWVGTTCTRTSTSGRRRLEVPATRNASRPAVVEHRVMTLRTLIVDDCVSFRELAAQLLRRDGFDVVGTAATSAEALASVASLRPQVALVDIHLGADSGFELARRLVVEHARQMSVVLMSSHSEDELAELLAESPAAGFVAKERLSGAAVRAVLARGTVA